MYVADNGTNIKQKSGGSHRNADDGLDYFLALDCPPLALQRASLGTKSHISTSGPGATE